MDSEYYVYLYIVGIVFKVPPCRSPHPGYFGVFLPTRVSLDLYLDQQLSVTLQKLEADMVLSDSREHYTRVAAPSTSDRMAFDGLPLDFTAADTFLATLDGAL